MTERGGSGQIDLCLSGGMGWTVVLGCDSCTADYGSFRMGIDCDVVTPGKPITYSRRYLRYLINGVYFDMLR